MDSFSADVFLGALEKGASPEKVWDLMKGLQNNAPTEDQVAKAEAMKGRRCAIAGTRHVGEVLGANTTSGGFYGGDRFPVKVRVDPSADCPKGDVFEYGFDQVVLL